MQCAIYVKGNATHKPRSREAAMVGRDGGTRATHVIQIMGYTDMPHDPDVTHISRDAASRLLSKFPALPMFLE